MTTQDKNKLIAEFMKVPFFFGKPYNDDIEEWEVFTNNIFTTEQLQYHTSWDWLMSVVEKIEGIGASVIIGRFFCEIKYSSLDDSKHFDVRMAAGVKIIAVNSAVVGFIQWYNENKKP